MQGRTKITPSEFVTNFIKVEGKEFSGVRYGFEGWPYLKDIYDSPSQFMVLQSSRQAAKSTTIGNIMLTYLSLESPISALYVGRSDEQATQFSRDRLKLVIENSPLLKELVGVDSSQNVHNKEFNNGSIIRIRSAGVSADRVRGISARFLSLDEVQDIPTTFLPVIFECTATFPENKKIILAGTPLSWDNTLSRYFYRYSNQNEWMIKCSSCNTWNILGIKNIGKEGLVCSKCGKPINYLLGQWVGANSKSEFDGYRFNQLMTPYSYLNWNTAIISKLNQYPANQFYNEVLGLPYDQGVKPITPDQLRACCSDYGLMVAPNKFITASPTFAGIDWGTGDVSYTVLVIGGLSGSHIKIYYLKRYKGVDSLPDRSLEHICKMIRLFNCNKVAADWGGGMKYNFDLHAKVSPNHPVIQIQESGTSGLKLKYDGKGNTYVANRTMMLSDVYWMIKKKMLDFPKESDFWDEFNNDYLCPYIEETNYGLRYDHPPGEPDDVLHATAFMLIAAQLTVGLPYLYSPEEAALVHRDGVKS